MRALIIHPEGNSYNNPSLKAIIDLFRIRGYAVDLRFAASPAPVPKVDLVRLMPYNKHVRRLKKLVFEVWSSKFLAYVMVAIESLLKYRTYDLVLGVDRQGLIEAAILHRLRGTPYVLLSFEILFAAETSVRFKSLERWASASVSFWVVQDTERAGCLVAENGLDQRNRFLLPLASEGAGTTGDTRLRDRLGIPPERKVGILIGGLSKWSMASQILDTLSGWPDEWVLILHERYGRTWAALAESSHERLLDTGKLFLSDTPVDAVDDMGFLLAGISAGLAFYKPDFEGPYWGRNLVHLGLASGKISTYLRYGVPVVTNEIGRYADEIRKNGLGVVVDGPEEIAGQLGRFGNGEWRQRVREYFRKNLDFALHRDRLWESLEGAMNRTNARGEGR